MTPGDLGLVVLRLVVGLTFAAHGAQKAFGWWRGPGWAGWCGAMTGMGFRPANLWAVVSIGAELVGGLLLAVGLLTPFAAMALVGQSVVIVLKVHRAKGFWSRDGGFEFPLSLAAGVVALAGTGPGSASLDAALGLSYSAELRGLLIAVGVLGALVPLAISRVLQA
ncbi:MAG: DoxX family protein, partial [Actinomycetota bacterium]|nr:DoxX family protein [Actinomycetota bacterium]